MDHIRDEDLSNMKHSVVDEKIWNVSFSNLTYREYDLLEYVYTSLILGKRNIPDYQPDMKRINHSIRVKLSEINYRKK